MAGTGNLRDAFLNDLRDCYDAERQLMKALPKLARTATSPDLQAAFEAHLDETQAHVDRLEAIFGQFGERVRGRHCDGMAGILDEGKHVMKEAFDTATMDAALIASAQRVEHYEMAAYGTLAAWARSLGRDDAAALLQQNLDEEKAADEKLTLLAGAGINDRSAREHGNGNAARSRFW